LALWKSLHYIDNYFHTTNRSNSKLTFIMLKREANDDAERPVKSRKFGELVQLCDLITRRKFGNRFVEAILHQVNKSMTASYGLNLVAFLFIHAEIQKQRIESSVDFGIVRIKHVSDYLPDTLNRFFMFGRCILFAAVFSSVTTGVSTCREVAFDAAAFVLTRRAFL
jgi:hypothetical protein